ALEHQPALTGTFGERLNAPVKLIAATVEDHAERACRLGSLGEQQSSLLRLLGRLKLAQRRLGPVDRGQGAPGIVVDQLRRDPAVGAKHGDTRTLGGAADLGPNTTPAPEATRFPGLDAHARLPTFLATNSPS